MDGGVTNPKFSKGETAKQLTYFLTMKFSDFIKTASHKSVGYAFPTSSNAARFGFDKQGCYIVALGSEGTILDAVAGFETLQSAKDFAATLPQLFSKYSLQTYNHTVPL